MGSFNMLITKNTFGKEDLSWLAYLSWLYHSLTLLHFKFHITPLVCLLFIVLRCVCMCVYMLMSTCQGQRCQVLLQEQGVVLTSEPQFSLHFKFCFYFWVYPPTDFVLFFTCSTPSDCELHSGRNHSCSMVPTARSILILVNQWIHAVECSWSVVYFGGLA